MVLGYSRYTRKSQAVEIRDAIAEDAPDACQVLRRSIKELCAADHRNDPGILARWLENKTPDLFRSWLHLPGNSVLVAVGNGAILAVGAVSGTGRITLNYVSPDARFQGVSRALLAALEQRALRHGNSACTLISTRTARRFYRAAGYSETGPPENSFGTGAGYPMRKPIRTG
jgi:GNAT superfamily N-acetyltransferase